MSKAFHSCLCERMCIAELIHDRRQKCQWSVAPPIHRRSLRRTCNMSKIMRLTVSHVSMFETHLKEGDERMCKQFKYMLATPPSLN